MNEIQNKKENILNQIEGVLKNIITCKWLYYVIAIVLGFGIYYLNLRDTMRTTNMWDEKYIKYYFIGAVLVGIVIILLLIFNNKSKKIPIHFQFLILALILGFTYTFAAPVFTQSDESFHFIRAYQVSRGHLVSPYDEFGNSYDMFPESIINTLWDDDDHYPEFKNYEDSYRESKISLEKDKMVKKDIFMHNYVFLNYLPHALVIRLGTFLNFSPYVLGLLGRIANMLCCIGLVTLGIYLIPFGKKSLSILLLAPSVLSYFASLSADGIIIATSFLLLALILKYRKEKTKLNWKHYLLLFSLVAFVATCKIAYLPIIGLLFLLPKECFHSKKQKGIWIGSLLIAGLVFCVTWISICHVPVTGINGDTGWFRYIRFIYVFINTMVTNIMDIIQNIFAGNFMYQTQVRPFAILSYSYLIIWILSLLSEKDSMEFRLIEKFWTSLIMIATILLVSYAMYTTNTPASSITIIGIQGRYFVPLCLMIPLLLPKGKLNVPFKELLNVSLILNMYVLLNIIMVFVI